MLNKILYVISSVLLSTVFMSCEDDLRIDEIIPEGEGSISFEVTYNPLRAVKVNTGESRTAGNAIGAIKELTVYMYDAEENLVDIFPSSKFSDYKINQSGNSEMPSDGGKQAESTTAKATFTIAGIPFGKYYFYVVANMAAFSKDKVPTVNDLKSKTVTWDVDDIAANNQMFGYFTYPGDDESSKGFDAQLCTIAKKETSLHAWMKRAASKVTVCFDGSGLNENVWIYVKSVTIKDIPATCTIGKENKVPIEPISAGVTNPGQEPNNWNTVFAKGETLFYNKDGVIKNGTKAADDYHNWLTVAKGSGIQGSVSKEGKEHTEDAEALYFYENCQGDFKDNPNKAWYDKQVKDIKETGENSYKWGQKDFKDNVPGGTYIEVEGYYVSTNPNQVSNGPIIYRFMLGQDIEYNYNAARNDHYKVTLGFKGYANQPDWHINYAEKDPEIYTGQTYYLSYAYNQKGIFPIRIVGNVTEFEVEIVENNWAPYDATNATASWDSVPPQTVGEGAMAFKWNRNVYMNSGYINTTEDATSKGFYYGLHKTDFSDEEIAKGAPRYRTPIWAGFLALQVPEDPGAVIFANDDGYEYYQNVHYLKNYFYATDGGGHGKYTNKIDQHIRKFSKDDLSFSEGQTEKTVGTGNNACRITKAKDGSITVHLPMWTRQKNLFSISGFTGNNPYDTYQRKATVKLKAKYESNTVTQFKPVYQVRRVVNPKGVWRRWDDNTSFNVKLTRRLTADAPTFTEFDSDGEWRAHISIGSTDFISLSGGDRTEGDYIYGKTDTPINFTVNFSGVGQKETKCAVIQIEYHGFTCSHQIFVRQGYFNPIKVVGSARWSSFSLYSCDAKTPYETVWDEANPKYINAVVTASPLALGTLFKRGNYAEGILIANNATDGFGVLQNPGDKPFQLTNGETASWSNIKGIPFSNNTSGNKNPYPEGSINNTFRWGRFKATVLEEPRYYRVPTHDEYMALLQGEYGVGVLYADGATEPAKDVDVAYGFEDFDNSGDNNTSEAGNKAGMRGIIVYNPTTANQVFFPIGARGIGRRTLQNASSTKGILRYGAVPNVLDAGTSASPQNNQYRPIPYNLPASPGAIYWTNQVESNSFLSWDMNYFDLNFNAYDFTIGYNPTGDALPIKLVVDEDGPKNDTSRKR